VDDWTVIVPEPGRVAEVARGLLALATDSSHVMSQRGGNEFRVPPYLADLYSTPPAPPKKRVVRTKKEGDE